MAASLPRNRSMFKGNVVRPFRCPPRPVHVNRHFPTPLPPPPIEHQCDLLADLLRPHPRR